jgi:hypothetical protein
MVSQPSGLEHVSMMLSLQFFGNWLHNINHRDMFIILLEAVLLLWPLWLCRNDKILVLFFSPMQVIFQCAHYFWSWSILHKPEHVYRGLLTTGASGEGYFYLSWGAA